MQLNEVQARILRKKFERYKELTEPKIKGMALQGWKYILNIEIPEADSVKKEEVKKVKEELAQVLARIANNSKFESKEKINISDWRKMMGISLIARAVESLVGRKKALQLIEKEVFYESIQKNLQFSERIKADSAAIIAAVAGVVGIASGGIMIGSVLLGNLTYFAASTAVFLTSSALILWLFGADAKNSFHRAILLDYVKDKKN
ncbi:MAG: hypothetical protein QXT25_04215 [Candidatus Anstonellaceae archaeon]